MKVRSPQFASDLYRDLRDRRLLLPVVALLVAIVAVPVVLKSDSSVTPPPAPPAALAEDAAQAAPAVLVADSGVRNYRERLAALKQKNPFDQKFVLPPQSSVDLESTGDTVTAPDAGSGTVDAVGGGDPATSVSDSVDTAVNAANDAVETEPSEPPDSSEPAEPAEPSKSEVRFYAGRIDVTVGELGDAKRVDGVSYLELLPSASNPVVAFLGLAEGGEGAAFSVSRDVVETDGDGSCAPKKPAPCQFLTMHVGDQQTFKYADGRTFRLTLRDTEIVRVPDPREQQGDDQSAPTAD